MIRRLWRYALRKATDTRFESYLKRVWGKIHHPYCVYRKDGSLIDLSGHKPDKTGGEADIFDLRKHIGEDLALKIWRS